MKYQYDYDDEIETYTSPGTKMSSLVVSVVFQSIIITMHERIHGMVALLIAHFHHL